MTAARDSRGISRAGERPVSFDADVIIVGAGPAGLSAALILARACRSVLIFDAGEPRNAQAQFVNGFLTRDGVSPHEFLRCGRDDIRKYDNVRLDDAVVTKATCGSQGFSVDLADGRTFRSRKLLIATGVVDNIPNIAGLEPLFGRSVFHCPFCDGWDYRGKGIAVYGRGARGYGLSLELLGWSRDVVLCTDGDSELDGEQRIALSRNGIAVREERIELLEGMDGQLERIRFAGGASLEREALFFTLGQHPRSPLARELGCEFNEKGTVRTGRHETTSVPGLFVAGDASRDVQWVIVAAAEGAEAAYAITQDLIREDLR